MVFVEFLAFTCLMLLGIAIFLMLFGTVEKSREQKKLSKYEAAERFVVYHMGGLPGVRIKQKMQLFMKSDRLFIEIPRSPMITISTRDMRKVQQIDRTVLDDLHEDERQDPDHFPDSMKFLWKLGQKRYWTILGRIERYIVLYYTQNGKEYAIAFGFRYGEAENSEDESVHRCAYYLDRYMKNSRTVNPEDAVGTVNLKKKSKPLNGVVLWRKDSESGEMRRVWEERS